MNFRIFTIFVEIILLINISSFSNSRISIIQIIDFRWNTLRQGAHDRGPGVPSQRGLEDPGQLGVPHGEGD